jgi:RNA polymerase sigma-70 factor (ECF subfamily)
MSTSEGSWASGESAGTGSAKLPDSSTSEEALLIARSRHRDVAAFNQLILLHQQAVYTLCYRMLSDPESAADVTQDSLLAAFRAIESFRGGSFRSWLLRIASNACYDHWRRKQRRPAESLEALTDQSEGNSEGQAQQFADDERWNPETMALRAELRALIQIGLEQLPFEQRLAVVLSDVQGLSYEEIATTTNTTLGTVKSRIARGRAQLRDYLQRHAELLPRSYRLKEERGRGTE